MAAISTTEYTIRHATQSDVPTILAMINELATYEHALHEVKATESSLTSTLSFPAADDDDNKTQSTTSGTVGSGWTPGYAKTILLIPHNGEPAGMALYFHNYSTWRSAPGIYLEDLFVRPAYRGKGYGTALIRALARECTRLQCRRLEWSVLKWNEPSIRFYQGDSIGATRMEEWVGMRVDGERLLKLAEKQDGEISSSSSS